MVVFVIFRSQGTLAGQCHHKRSVGETRISAFVSGQIHHITRQYSAISVSITSPGFRQNVEVSKFNAFVFRIASLRCHQVNSTLLRTSLYRHCLSCMNCALPQLPFRASRGHRVGVMRPSAVAVRCAPPLLRIFARYFLTVFLFAHSGTLASNVLNHKAFETLIKHHVRHRQATISFTRSLAIKSFGYLHARSFSSDLRNGDEKEFGEINNGCRVSAGMNLSVFQCCSVDSA